MRSVSASLCVLAVFTLNFLGQGGCGVIPEVDRRSARLFWLLRCLTFLIADLFKGYQCTLDILRCDI